MLRDPWNDPKKDLAMIGLGEKTYEVTGEVVSVLVGPAEAIDIPAWVCIDQGDRSAAYGGSAAQVTDLGYVSATRKIGRPNSLLT